MKILIACEYSGTVRDAFKIGFPGYKVSSLGVVYGKTGIILKANKDKKGYLQVCFLSGKIRKTLRIHRIVAMLFLKNKNKDQCVRHLDGNKLNNRVDNLSWGSHKENEKDKILHGTWNTRYNGKLTKVDRKNIFKLHSNGFTQKDISELYNVSRPTITRLLNGTTWGKL